MNGKYFMFKTVVHVKCSCKVKLKMSLLINDVNDIDNIDAMLFMIFKSERFRMEEI